MILNSKRTILGMALLVSMGAFAQVEVTINHKVQKYIGDVSELNREKYVNVHSGIGNDTEMKAFANDYNVGGGRGFWGAFSYAKSKTGEAGVYPDATGANNTTVRSVERHVGTEHPSSTFKLNMDTQKAGEWVAEYYNNGAGKNSVPEYYEPMNEPFVHAGEFGSDQEVVRQQMSELFRDVGKAVHETPALANMKIIGYSSAWPSMELWDFGHWESRMKLFMDVAGEHIDAFATHLYDGFNVTGQNNYRSGSNAEAILDLIETYSYYKWDVVKPHAITEFGTIVDTEDGADWSPIANGRGNIGNNHIMMGLMDREDRMEISIPFTTDKSTWHINENNNCQPYGPVVLAPTNLGSCSPAGWEYTPRLHFYKIWQDVKGKRVMIHSANPDIQTQAFVDGNKLYVVLSNLDDKDQSVNLKYAADMGNVTSIKTKTLKTYDDVEAVYEEINDAQLPNKIDLIPAEVISIEYEFDADIEVQNTLRSKKYYNKTHLVAISGSATFNFNGVDLGSGSGNALVRLSVGRSKGKQVLPLAIKFNGDYIDVPNNWAGYDQANREDFFGMIEVPLPFDKLKADNEITFTYPDAGGKISSVILDVELFDEKYVGINDKQLYKATTVLVYPTVVDSGSFKVKLEAGHQYSSLELFSIDGRMVSRQSVSNNDQSLNVDAHNLSNGVYMVKLSGANGNNVKRIVIE